MQAGKNPFLLNLMLREWRRVLRRLAYFYAQLAALPRRNRRALQRVLATSLVGTAMLFALSSAPVALANTITVGGTCTLSGAIENANDTATGQPDPNCAAGDPTGADTITLTENVVLSAALPQITSEITLEGNNYYVSGDNFYQVFYVTSTGDFTINETTIQDGSAVNGGGIYNAGRLAVYDSTLTGNFASAYGGGIYNANYAKLDHTTITLNYAGDEGGGICNAGTLVAYYTTISENDAPEGGGIVNYEGEITLTDSEISGNTADFGTAMLNEYGTATLLRTTVTENGYSCGCYFYGGTIINTPDSTLNVYSSTIDTNYGGFVGGAIINGGQVIVRESVITGNSAFLGGGIMTAGGTVTIAASTLNENDSYVGGGLFNYYGQTYMSGTTFDKNDSFIGGGIANGIPGFSSPRPISGQRGGKDAGEPSPQAQAHKESIRAKFPQISARGKWDQGKTRTIVKQVLGNHHGEARVSGAQAVCEEECPGYANTYLANSTLSGNTAYGGGGITNGPYGLMGLYNVTVTGNNAEDYAGGIFNVAGGSIVLARSIVSGNTSSDVNEIVNTFAAITADNYNLFGHSGETNDQAFYGFTPGTTDFNATSDGGGGTHVPTALAAILNTTLASNGGPTNTHALLLGSPAVDKGPNDDCIVPPIDDIDQRGLPRNVNINNGDPNFLCDIGAYELQIPTAVNVAPVQARLNPKGKAIIKWRTLSEAQVAGFNIYRKVVKHGNTKSKWEKINGNFKQAKNPGAEVGDKYRFTNRTLQSGKTYRYKVQVVYLDGHTEWTNIVTVQAP